MVEDKVLPMYVPHVNLVSKESVILPVLKLLVALQVLELLILMTAPFVGMDTI